MLHDQQGGWMGGWVAILYTASLSELSRKRVFCSNYLVRSYLILVLVIPLPKGTRGISYSLLYVVMISGDVKKGGLITPLSLLKKVRYYIILVEKKINSS